MAGEDSMEPVLPVYASIVMADAWIGMLNTRKVVIFSWFVEFEIRGEN